MANVKLKSIFTKEDIYTVLQLLKALADGADTNDADLQSQIDELKNKLDSYAVDASGNITLNDTLHVAKNGDVEVGKNLEVDGNIVKGFTGFYEISIKNVGSATKMDCPVFEGWAYDPESTRYIPIFYAFFLTQDIGITSDPAGAVLHMGILMDDAGTPITNVEDISTSFVDITQAMHLATDAQIQTVNSAIVACSKAKYQHTVTILAYSSENKSGIKIVFTGYSSKNTPIDSYQDLNEVFGGCTLAASGCVMVGNDAKGAIGINLHGGTIATDFIMATDGAQTNYKVMLSDLNAPVFTDDVCIPK